MTEQTDKVRDPKIEEAREHMRAAHKEMQKVIESLFPEGMRDSQRAACKEMLLGIRSLVDAAIENTEKTSK